MSEPGLAGAVVAAAAAIQLGVAELASRALHSTAKDYFTLAIEKAGKEVGLPDEENHRKTSIGLLFTSSNIASATTQIAASLLACIVAAAITTGAAIHYKRYPFAILPGGAAIVALALWGCLLVQAGKGSIREHRTDKPMPHSRLMRYWADLWKLTTLTPYRTAVFGATLVCIYMSTVL